MALRKNMRNTAHVALVTGLLLILCFCSACTSPSPSQEQAVTTPSVPTIPTMVPGLSSLTPGMSGSTTGFEIAETSMGSYNPVSDGNSSFEKTVYRIQGKRLDSSGAAAVWIFTVRIGNTNELLTFDGSTWRNSTISSGDFPGVIALDRMITPQELFSRNQQTLFPAELSGAAVTRDLDLANSVYAITITSGTDMKVYRFDATTGVLIS